MLKENYFFCFIHIEKAGGITMHNLFHHLFPTYISPNPDVKFGEFIDSAYLKKIANYFPFKIQGIGGHRVASFLDYESVIGEKILYFTFMRDPIKRYMSHLNWQKNVMGVDWSVERFIEDEHFNNYQAYRIAGVRDYNAAMQQIKNNYNFIGLLERYDESLLLLARYLQMPLQKMVYQQSNVKQYDFQYDFENQIPSVQEKIIENNKIDLQLYDFVSNRLFAQQLKEYSELEKDLNFFKSIKTDFFFPKQTLIKRKLSNLYLKKIVQPLALNG